MYYVFMTEKTPSFIQDDDDQGLGEQAEEQDLLADQADLDALAREEQELASAVQDEVYPTPTDDNREDIPSGKGSYHSDSQ